jgi:hypothetical protein
MNYDELNEDVIKKTEELHAELRRVKIFEISSDTLVELFQCLASGSEMISLPDLNWPSDAHILGVSESDHGSTISFKVWSSTFDVVGYNERIPLGLSRDFHYTRPYEKIPTKLV